MLVTFPTYGDTQQQARHEHDGDSEVEEGLGVVQRMCVEEGNDTSCNCAAYTPRGLHLAAVRLL